MRDSYLCVCSKDMDLLEILITRLSQSILPCATSVRPVGRAKHQLGDVVSREVVIETPSKTYDII